MKALPFACLRPAPAYAADVAALPYDVYTSAEAARAVADRPLSFLNIDRPETQFPPGHDMYAPEVYERAAELLRARVNAGVYVDDPDPCYYLYELESGGRAQTGVVAVCPIDEFLDGTVREHEKTRPEKERDRICHIEALGAQTGPIFLSYRDTAELDALAAGAAAAPALYNFTDDEGCHQRVWRIAEPRRTAAIEAAFSRVERAYIADGHHRTASAVRVGLERRAAAQAAGTYTGREPFNYVLCVLFPAGQLNILPYNRAVLDRGGMPPEKLVGAVRAAGFEVTAASAPVQPEYPGVIGMFCAGQWWRLRVKPLVEGEAVRVDPVSALDISVLQDRVLRPVLGIDDPRRDPRIRFVGGVRGLDELERVAGGEGAAFSMYATSIQQLFAVADAGLLMPPKSTWFEPKLRSGLFIHRI